MRLFSFTLLALSASLTCSLTVRADADSDARAALALGAAKVGSSCPCIGAADCTCDTSCGCARCGEDASARKAARTATVTVACPPDSELWFNDAPTKQKGGERLFTTPPLPAGDCHYDVTARYCSNGVCVTRTKQVTVTPGAAVRVEFDFPNWSPAPVVVPQFQTFAPPMQFMGGFGGACVGGG